MPRSEINALTLLAVFLTAGLSGTIAVEPSPYAQPLVGVVLLIVLFSYDRDGSRDMAQSLAFGAVAGYCATRVVLYPAELALRSLGNLPWFPVIWILLTQTFWAIDISRMGKRATLQPYPANPGYVPSPAPAPVPTPTTPLRQEPVHTPAAAPPPRPATLTSLFSQPASPPPPSTAVEPAFLPSAAAAPPPQAVALPRGSGKPATIYLNLVGEGLAVLRTVQAEHLGKDYYLIVEKMPPGETWEFQTGQVVRCQKRNLSSGKGLVAVEEAPRAS